MQVSIKFVNRNQAGAFYSIADESGSALGVIYHCADTDKAIRAEFGHAGGWYTRSSDYATLDADASFLGNAFDYLKDARAFVVRTFAGVEYCTAGCGALTASGGECASCASPEPENGSMNTEFYDVTNAVADFRAAGRDDLADEWIAKAGTMTLRWCGFTIFRPLLALPAATGSPFERRETLGDAIDRRAEALNCDYGKLAVDPAMRALMAASDEAIADDWREYTDYLCEYFGEEKAAPIVASIERDLARHRAAA